ncbi:MAG: glutamine amidotransferase-related protein, partial [Solirubrobacteraceae bacterium]
MAEDRSGAPHPTSAGVRATAKRLLVVDNYDSFTYNLVHLFQELGVEVVVHRNDAITVD